MELALISVWLGLVSITDCFKVVRLLDFLILVHCCDSCWFYLHWEQFLELILIILEIFGLLFQFELNFTSLKLELSRGVTSLFCCFYRSVDLSELCSKIIYIELSQAYISF